jgi:hypothetical protein
LLDISTQKDNYKFMFVCLHKHVDKS